MSGSRVTIKLGGASYGMRPDYASYREIEDRTDMTVPELLRCAVQGTLKMQEAVEIVWCGAKAAGEKFDDISQVGVCLFESRLTNPEIRTSICKFLMALMYAPDLAAKKFEAEVEPMIQADQETG